MELQFKEYASSVSQLKGNNSFFEHFFPYLVPDIVIGISAARVNILQNQTSFLWVLIDKWFYKFSNF